MAAIDGINSAYDKAVIKPAIIHTPAGNERNGKENQSFGAAAKPSLGSLRCQIICDFSLILRILCKHLPVELANMKN